MSFFRQTNTLTNKTLKIILTRHLITTVYSALILPVIASVYLGLGQNFNQPNSKFGIGDPYDIRPLGDALSQAAGGRNTVAFVNNGHSGGEIDRVIDSLSAIVKGAGKNATKLTNADELGYVCRSSIRGTSTCFGAVVFHSSPDEGNGKLWNYTLRADGGLGVSFRVDRDSNDAQIYALPLQRAVDAAIAGSSFPDKTQQYAFTADTEDERQARLRRNYQSSFINYLSVAFLIALIGVCYHMPGLIATERESGMSQLIDAMMPVKRGWHRQFARLISHHNAFTVAYLPGWIIASVICRILIWKNTSYAIMIIFFVLSGIAITSMSLLGASFFKKAQLSGAVTAVVWIILGVIAQALNDPGTPAVTVLSLLFTPCTFVFFITYIARYEQEGNATNLVHAPPNSPWNLPGIILWLFLVFHIFVYPIIAAYLERTFHGVTTGVRNSRSPELAGSGADDVVRVDKMTKIYRPSLLRRLFSFVSPPRPRVVAVDNLTLSVKRGQILALLGANGSGKSTTLDIIAGIGNFTTGNVSIDASGGLGIAPQKNVLWDELTVEEHIKIFNELKSPQKHASAEEVKDLIHAIGLREKTKSWAKTLSGGQKRKLQLGMMLTGGSAVCCVDEVSSGIDPLSRRKIWDILLSERGSRTIIMTTHFLDEADLLADSIAILSKGTLRAEGSSAQLKDSFGAGYRVHVLNARYMKHAPQVGGVECKVESNTITYVAPSSSLAAEVIRVLEAERIPYKFSGPTIEDVFLNLAEEVKDEKSFRSPQTNSLPFVAREKSNISEDAVLNGAGKDTQGLLSGRPVGWGQQVVVFLRKRFVIFKTNWIPYVAAFLIPIIAAAITQKMIRGESAVGCSPTDQSNQNSNDDYTDLFKTALLVGGPSSKFTGSGISDLFKPLVPAQSGGGRTGNGEMPLGNITLQLVNSPGSFNKLIKDNRKNVTPGGWWLGDSGSAPTLAYKADELSMYTAVMGQSFLDTMLANKSIATTYAHFDFPVAPITGKALQLVIYFALACSIYPGLFGLYPNVERRMNVRGLQYSSGARTLPVWAAHLLFDFSIMLVSMAIATIIFATASNVWYHQAYLFPVFMLYGLVSILVAYFFSLFCGSSLATYAATSVLQGLGFAVYMIAFLYILTYSSTADAERNTLVGHWIISAIFPTGSLIRAFFVALNTYATSCDGDRLRANPGAMTAYGGPILYLAVQAILLFTLVVWFESGDGKYAAETAEKSEEVDDPEIANELVRVDGPEGKKDGLRVAHLAKAFGKNIAVDNVTFGVEHGEVFALLGPNGAGKSTTISLIRGDIAPSKNGGDVFVEEASVTKNRALARQNLGVCPQFDAIDSMTVVEHLQHFARIRGITDVKHQVQAVVRAVGLDAYTNVMAHTLSGGNKRKLSLAIALTGNPSVILLDEPSSGLDAAAKRIMWRTLETIVPGRSILLTTHSMEEADALANRAGIMARRMLALGSTDTLRYRFGDTLHVHLVSKTAPHSTAEEIDRVRSWVLETFPGAEVEQETFHGQMRFSIPTSAVEERHRSSSLQKRDLNDTGSAIGHLLIMLEENKDALGIAHHSVSPTTLNEVFLTIVGQHDVVEEGYKQDVVKEKPWWKKNIWEF
ncbi:ABC transporter ced-7 [Tolypocladium ophioglossoides CBS 100239]|uniref:ABC transporter ced-7 n=1 Tax=Tolypocladium ophioglossoides (strain CBS 100239) TaxID=1163406 RepID=A0A0L0NDW1_TOLOC|nr:ABC transporter ced-7 [Tolypocladium ophioglossoides CBS 100239]